MVMNIAVVNQKEYSGMLRRVLALLDCDPVFIGYQEQAPEGHLVLTCDRIATKGSKQPVFDISHGVFWAKSGKEVFKSGVRVDYYIASSPYEMELLRVKGILPHVRKVYPTGRPDLDDLKYYVDEFSKERRTVEKQVLYAPTWNYELNGGAGTIKRNILALSEACTQMDAILNVALHPFINSEEWIMWIKSLCAGIRVREIDEPFMPMLAEADVLVSDCSSNAEQFLLTGKPIVLYNSFDWFNSFDYNDACMIKDPTESIQPRFRELRKVAYQFTGQQFVKPILEMALSENESMKMYRKQLCNTIWGDVFDGRCADRVAEAIVDAYEDCRRRGEVK